MSNSRPSSRLSDALSSTAAEFDFEDSDTDENNMGLRQRTLNHPLGDILLTIAAENLSICKKLGIAKDTNEHLDELCTKFKQALKYERDRTRANLENQLTSQLTTTSENIEQSILEKELGYNSVNQAIDPPTVFSQGPTLINSARLTEYLKLFPIKATNKFSGLPNSNQNIFEFLASLNQGQEIAQLSLPEFMTALLRSTTGKAYTLISNYIDHSYSLKDIYAQLVLMFDYRQSPQQAKRTLADYQAVKGENLTKICGNILSLANRIASSLPKGASRTALFDLESCNALINSLPASSSILASNVYSTLTSRLQRHPTYVELCKMLAKHHDVITNDVLIHGQMPRNSMENQSRAHRLKIYSARAENNYSYRSNRTARAAGNRGNNWSNTSTSAIIQGLID